MSFDSFALTRNTLAGIQNAGYTKPLPIQERVIPAALEGRDIVGCSQTGTGKTAAYLIPVIEGLQDAARARRFRPRALILAPTRELAHQIYDNFQVLASETKLRAALLHGGVEIGPQEVALNTGCELVIATPGRLLDHLSRGGLKLRELIYLVIDEADRLFDSGFLPDLRSIIDHVPERRQTMLFSATMPPEMEKFGGAILREPVRVQVGLVAPRDNVEESLWPVPDHQKLDLLERVLAEQTGLDKVMVFVRTRAKARNFTARMAIQTGLAAGELHSELPQAERDATIARFRAGEIRMLVATDIASRGLDFTDVTHVINFDVPNSPDDYIHRIGRTARVDSAGVAITLVAPEELALAAAIEAAVRRNIPMRRIPGFPYEVEQTAAEAQLRPTKRKTSAKHFTQRETTAKKKESPFTRSGKLKKRFQDGDPEEKPRRGGKRRAERSIVNRRLPHQRKKS